MLSPSAWGALLKVMEEPPEYVKFILATTEVHKVPATIISRCQRYDFHRIRTADIAARLQHIAEAEQIALEPEAAQLIAHLSDGGMRAALSLLDQCASCGDQITPAFVTAICGASCSSMSGSKRGGSGYLSSGSEQLHRQLFVLRRLSLSITERHLSRRFPRK